MLLSLSLSEFMHELMFCGHISLLSRLWAMPVPSNPYQGCETDSAGLTPWSLNLNALRKTTGYTDL